MGLRQLYFLVGGMLKRLVYLSLGLSVILGFIGIKLVLHAMHQYHWADWAPFDGEIPIWLSLGVIVGTLTITTLASLAKSKRDDATRTAPEAI
jgi:tellurite resistance protein TerC